MKKNKPLRVLCIMTVWNEMKFLPLKIEFCKQNKLEPYIIDNMSTDGSWEWLQENDIPCHQIDTKEAFHLKILQNEIVKTTHELKPDWVIYNGCDLFPVTLEPLYDVIKKIDKEGYNCISMKRLRLSNTGEEKSDDPINTYFYYDLQEVNVRIFIYKYYLGFKIGGDTVSMFSKKSKVRKKRIGVMLEYGDTKSKAERTATLRRRRKAWRMGLHRKMGKHYRRGAKNNWIKSKEGLEDIRKTTYAPYLKKLQEVSNKLYNKNECP